MLSNKLTFSLTSLIVLLIMGLICAVPSVLANDGDEAHIDKAGTKGKSKTAKHVDFSVTLSAAESMMDVSFRGDSNADNIQIMRGATDADETIQILAKFGVVVNLADPANAVDADTDLAARTGNFSLSDVIIDAYDKKGRALGLLSTAMEAVDATDADDPIATVSHRDPNNPGKEFLIQIDEARLVDAYTALRGGGAALEIGTLLVSIPPESVQDATLSEVIKQRKGEHEPHWNKVSNVFQIDFVEADPGNPTVVTIDRILDRSSFSPIEAGRFKVRVILTEEPRMGDKSGLTTDMIQVDGGGSATAVDAGVTIDGSLTTDDPPVRTTGDLMLPIVGTYYIANDSPGTSTTAVMGTGSDLPTATGRDNKYYTYSVEITPDPGVDGNLTISIKQFMDHVKPVSNQYLPLSAERRVATTLSDNDEAVRNARLMNETVSVPVHAISDQKVEAATAAYEARDEVFKGVANETQLANKFFIPAGGYLVLVKGTADTSGVVSVPDKIKDRQLTAAQALYRVKYEFGLSFPADNLDTFFRNGGTLTLAYADIPEATGSGHGDSKGATGDDTTDYTAASTNAYTAGALIFNEIMWGLDGNDETSQYIELYNPGTTAISIDNKEWVISVGDEPAGFTVIDTVSNNPATGYWPVPGMGGVTEVDPSFPVAMDLVSMSRMTDAADGTAAASWAASIRPSANLGGRRVGTPGAANKYTITPAPPPPPPPAPTPKALVAKGADLVISEIMVASNQGRLPQWIEIANVSGAEVSLMDWSLEVDNDPMDKDVVGESATVPLGDVTLGKDQVALVITKTSTRNSGVGMGKGDIREDRIINAQSQVSPDDARYSLISEMAFKLALLPPQKGGVVSRGDVVGNLGMGWELPMAESGRSSLIRRKTDNNPNMPGHVASKDIAGTDAAGWVLASETMLDGAYRTTYYGDDEDEGTPGYDAGGALPVQLSKFGAKRDPVTGQVVITWETQSELNNAGFFIKRSQQTNGQFQVVNPTMIAGAGTTSEKQSYTYTDTTAQPNIVYYYQIEDVSLDGNRQTLTRGHRLKGHIGAAGKATTTWGDLKSSRDQ